MQATTSFEVSRIGTLSPKGLPNEHLQISLKVLRLDPTFDGGSGYGPCAAFKERARIFERTMNDVEGALVELAKAIEHCPNDYQSYYIRSRMHEERGELAEAIADCTEAIRRKQDQYTFTTRGELYLRKGELDKAIADFTAAIGISPWRSSYLGRGQAHERKGDLQAALVDFDQAGGREQAARGSEDFSAVCYLRVKIAIARESEPT